MDFGVGQPTDLGCLRRRKLSPVRLIRCAFPPEMGVMAKNQRDDKPGWNHTPTFRAKVALAHPIGTVCRFPPRL